jgi:hypothetical protein
MYADEWPEDINLVQSVLNKLSFDDAEQEDADARLHWKRGDYAACADVEGQRACQRASGLNQSAESYGG